MISSLSLENWRTHKGTAIEFGKGTNLIIGIMGSGKSGMLDGLSYALYGTFPALKRRDASIGDVVSYGENEARLGITFASNGKTYRVSRGIKKSGEKFLASAKLYEGEKVLETGQGKVTEEVSRILGMDYDLFTRAVYSEQNEIDYFLTIDPGRRKKEMDRLLGLDRFETARASAVSILNRISSEADALSSSFDPKEHESLLSGKEEKEKLLESLIAQEALSEKEFASIKESISSVSGSLAQLEEKKKKRDLARTSLERAKAKIEAISSELEGKKPSGEKVSALKARIGSISKQKESLNTELRSFEQEHSALSQKLGNLNSRIESSRAYSDSLLKAEKELAGLLSGKPFSSLKKLAEEKEAENVSIASRIESIAHEISELEKVAAAMKPGHPECPLCGSELGEEKSRHIAEEKNKIVSSRRKELASLKEALPKSRKELSGILEKARRADYLTEKISELRAKSEGLPALEKEKAEAEKQLSVFKSRKEELLSRREKIEKEYSAALLGLKEEEGLLKKAEALRQLEEEKQKSESLFSSLEFDDSILEKARKSLEEARVREERARSSLQMLRKERSSVSDLLSMVEKRLIQIEKAKKDSEHLLKLREELTLYKNSLIELQSELRAEMTGAISSAMNEIWPVLYPYADYRQIRITGTEKDYFFEVYDGEWRRLEKVASGGERACLSLTLRIALSTVLTPGVGWMMLDEPTHNLDRDAVSTLSEALENKVPDIIPQSIVITHEENLMSSEFARSYKFSRDKESLGPTVIEEI